MLTWAVVEVVCAQVLVGFFVKPLNVVDALLPHNPPNLTLLLFPVATVGGAGHGGPRSGGQVGDSPWRGPHVSPLVSLTSVSSCSTFNYIGSHMNKLLSAFEGGDLIQARAIQVLPMRLLLHWSLFLLSNWEFSSRCRSCWVLLWDSVSDVSDSGNRGGILLTVTAGFLWLPGFDVGVNKQLMAEVSGLRLGPPRLPLLQCPLERSQQILQKYRSVFP